MVDFGPPALETLLMNKATDTEGTEKTRKVDEPIGAVCITKISTAKLGVDP